jgi:hypothetical protein
LGTKITRFENSFIQTTDVHGVSIRGFDLPFGVSSFTAVLDLRVMKFFKIGSNADYSLVRRIDARQGGGAYSMP